MLANNIRLSSILAVLYGVTGFVGLSILVANLIEDRGWGFSVFVLFVPVPLVLLATAAFFALGRRWPRQLLLVALALLVPFCIYLIYGWVAGLTTFGVSHEIAYLVGSTGVLLLLMVYTICAVLTFHSSHFQREVGDEVTLDIEVKVPSKAGKKLRRLFVALIGLAYLMTCFFGVPAVQSSADNWATNEYRRIVMQGRSDAGLKFEPHMKTYVSFPILPGVILSYRDYQLAGLYGFGGFQFHLWYVVGSVEIFSCPVWLS